ncbi:ribonuclease M5 [Caenibacillus caldisaponilyticus]|jgi:ribonuclease M5|uniref:ribonuclease M5 n=1 Tax=Caenibacillus caldisaponilyticus TaxID=1674942 RepID=UPI00098883BC|nr:ribonuclease M5 [Caenibacillus caldisaponilyticus]
MKVKEFIVVEGKSDTLAVRRAVDCDTIETNGSALDEATLEAIRHAADTRGVIIFTDPDVPGEMIRKTVSRYVPGCKHAFLTKREAEGRPDESLGIEHASVEAIRAALEKVYTVMDEPEEHISITELFEAGLIGGPGSKRRRERLGEKLRIGYVNGKQLYHRLRMFQISRTAFEEALRAIAEEEQHGKPFDGKNDESHS